MAGKQICHPGQQRFIRDSQPFERQQPRCRCNAVVVNPASVDLCSMWRDGYDAIPEAHISNELKRISKELWGQKEQRRLIASTAVRVGFENRTADTLAFQCKGTT